MTPPPALAHWLRLRVKVCRLQTLRKIERWTWRLVGALALVWIVTRFVL